MRIKICKLVWSVTLFQTINSYNLQFLFLHDIQTYKENIKTSIQTYPQKIYFKNKIKHTKQKYIYKYIYTKVEK